MNAFPWLSARSRAQMMDMSHHGALPIHFFWPLMIQVSPSRFAVVNIPPEVPDPTSGSVRPKQPIFSQRAIGGGHFFFFSFSPPREMGALAQPVWHPHQFPNHQADAGPSPA